MEQLKDFTKTTTIDTAFTLLPIFTCSNIEKDIRIEKKINGIDFNSDVQNLACELGKRFFFSAKSIIPSNLLLFTRTSFTPNSLVVVCICS